jgi:IS30 family transposase
VFTHSLPNDDNTIKSQPLNNVTQKELNYIMDQLKHRPRKTLGFKTAYKLLFKKNTLLTVTLHT